uniref:TBC1 domain family member 30-like n=1 Tax=Styela clava TaxID=7725 RepID=UPI00193A5010|nr:TBC1 domain family member 30-like [Styela clava]
MAQISKNSGNQQQRHLVQGLLSEIYHRYRADQQLDSSTETSCLSDATHSGGHQAYSETLEELKRQQTRKLQKLFLEAKSLSEVTAIRDELDERVTVISAKLVRQLRQRSRLREKHQRYCDMLTAILQAVSQKRRIDARLNFSLEPSPGKHGFKQWRETLRAILRLPRGIPEQWRKKVWGYLAENYIQERTEKNWNLTARHVFSDRFNPDDDRLDNQIVKDLHRTGYTNMSGDNSEEERMVLKRVLLAYARWNKEVGYCQGFNVLAALILEVTQNNAQLALKIMIYLVDGVLPESYFADNLRGLSVDMAVFRDLLRARLPELSKHFDMLQKQANENGRAHCYEPPLTNVFTMQWFLTLFATCLPTNTVLRVWDSVLLDGSEILLRVALAIWAKLGEQVGTSQTADEFYGAMAGLTQQTLNGKFICADELMKTVYKIATFPFPRLKELREKYKYNITPFAADSDTNGEFDRTKHKDYKYSLSHDSTTASESEPESQLERIADNEMNYYEDDGGTFSCFGGHSTKLPKNKNKAKKVGDLKSANPGAFDANSGSANNPNGMMAERMSTDIAALKRQYMKICNRQLQSNYLIYTKSGETKAKKENPTNTQVISLISGMPEARSPVAVNHLLIGRQGNKKSHQTDSTVDLNRTSLPWKDAVFVQKLKSPNRIKPKPIKKVPNPVAKKLNPEINDEKPPEKEKIETMNS